MKNLNDILVKIFSATFLLFLIFLFIHFLIQDKKNKSVNLETSTSNNFSPDDFYDNFLIEKISAVNRQGNDVLFSFSANKIIHRKRFSKFFVYQNLKEIYISDAQIDIYTKTYPSNLFTYFSDNLKSLIVFSKALSLDGYYEVKTDLELDLLTRFLFENLSITIHLPRGEKVSFTSSSGRIGSDFENMILEGQVRFILPDYREIKSYQAVWSKRFNGVYLPEGHMFERNYHKEKAFFAINRACEFVKVTKIPKIEYVDFIEENEERFYAYLSEKAPKVIRQLFIFPH